MREKRTITAPVVTSYNEVIEMLRNKELVFFVEGKAREEVLREVKDEKKTCKRMKIQGKLGTLGSAGIIACSHPVIGGVLLSVNGLIYLVGKLGDETRKYSIYENEEKERLEFVRTKGVGAFDPQYDTILNGKIHNQKHTKHKNKLQSEIEHIEKNIVSENWCKIIEKIESDYEFPDSSINTWIRPLIVGSVENTVIHIYHPFSSALDILTKKYTIPLEECICKVTGQELKVVFEKQ